MFKTETPLFIVEIDGKELPKDISQLIERLSYTDDEEKMDELAITIANGDLSIIDDKQLQLGKELQARWGYLGNLSDKRSFTIKEISYAFGEDAVARMNITALGKGHKLTGRAARTCWNNKKIADVVKDIAKKQNLTPKVDIPEDVTHEFISQGGKNDMVFLQELAKDTGCSTWVANDELHFEPNNVNAPVRTFHWREDRDGYLQSVSVTVKAEEGKATGRGTEVAGLDPLTKKPIKETVKAKDGGNGSVFVGAEPIAEVSSKDGDLTGQRTKNENPPQAKHDETGVVKASPAPTAALARRSGKGKVKSASMKGIEATATTIGLPYLKAKDTITIENIGKKFSGNWKIKKVSHTISKDSYKCSLTLCKSNYSGSKAGGNAPKTGKNNTTAKSAGAAASNKKPPSVVEYYSGDTMGKVEKP